MQASFVLALTAFWAVAVNHCRLEAVSNLALLTCDSPDSSELPHSHEHESQDCEDDGCSLVENGLYKSKKSYIATQPLLPAKESPDSPLLDFAVLADGPLPSRLLPDLEFLRVAWQFQSRAAPHVRAPTLS